MSTVAPPRALGIFFSYASVSHHFVGEFLGKTRFREILRGKVWNYRNTPLLVGGMREGLTKRMRECEVCVAFISGAYAISDATLFEFDEAIRLVTASEPGSRMRHLVVVIVDADGEAWWNERVQTITGWLQQPVYASFVNEHGTGPRPVDTIVGTIDDLAQQLKAMIAAAPPPPRSSQSEPQP